MPNVLTYKEWQMLKQGKHVNLNGYLETSPNKENPYNIIPTPNITMDGVNRRLKLIPEIGNPIVAEPNSGSYNFGNSKWVLEVPVD